MLKPFEFEKSKEEIKEEVLQWLYKEVKQPDKYLISIALGHAIRKTVERIRKACEFFLRYKDNPDLLMEEHPEYKELEYNGNRIGDILDWRNDWTEVWDDISEYNEWFFKLVFRGVFEDD